MGDAQHRLLLRPAHPAAAAPIALADAAPPPERGPSPVRLPVDAAVVPCLLLLIARNLALFDPPRVLAWRLLHDERLLEAAAWLGPLLPRPAGSLDRDPVALLLAMSAAGLAAVYLLAAALGARPLVRGALLAIAALVLVVLPTIAFIALGMITGRPYGQDGGVVQLPLAIDHVLAGRTPYGADYSGTMLGRQARVSDFWADRGGNPILHHHAYLPGTHLLMIPFFVAGRAAFGTFDPRWVTLVAYVACAVLAARLARDPERRLAAAAAVLVNPLVYWQQIFGANDLLPAVPLLAAVHLAGRGRSHLAAAAVGLACAVKQLAWPFAPFLIAQLSGAIRLADLREPAVQRRLGIAAGIAIAVSAAIVLPVAALDWRAFWGDIIVYNVGLPGGDNYPLGGTPGFGFANLLIYSGRVSSLRDHVSFAPLYVLLVPLGFLLLRRQLGEGSAAAALVTGSGALLLSLYFSRVVHPNYLVLAATLVPVGLCAGARVAAWGPIAALLLMATAVDLAEGEVMRAAWEDLAAHPGGGAALLGPLAPRAGEALTRDPLGLLLSAVVAALGIALLVSTLLAASHRAGRAILLAGLLTAIAAPAALLLRTGDVTGVRRLQDPWGGALAAAAGAGEVREAWSMSFRSDPPRALDGTLGAAAPVARALGRAGVGDPRWLALGGVLIAAGLIVAGRTDDRHGAATAVMAVAPAALGAVFGSVDLVWAALLLAAIRAGASVGILGLITLAAGLLRFTAVMGPGVSIANAFLHAGAEPGGAAPALAGLGIAILAAAPWVARRAASPMGVFAGLVMVALWLSPWASPDDILVPMVLAVRAATETQA